MKGKAIYLLPVVSLFFIAFVYPLPYGFYTLNRIITTLFATIGSLQTWEMKPIISRVLVFVAILFNPFIPIHLTREIWQYIDVAASLPFLILIFSKWGSR